MTMTGVERIIKALKRETPDIVPHFELIIDPKVREAILPGGSFEDFTEYMDLDAYIQGLIEQATISDLLDKLHIKVQEIFEMSITESLRGRMNE